MSVTSASSSTAPRLALLEVQRDDAMERIRQAPPLPEEDEQEAV